MYYLHRKFRFYNMIEHFSFIEPYILNILKNSDSICPGIKKVIAIYYNNLSDIVEAKCLKKSSNRYKIENIEIGDNNVQLNKFRTNKMKYNWYKDKELPFYINETGKIKMNVLDEIDNTILALYYPNEFDKKNDVLFYYFNKNTSNFNLTTSDAVLTTQDKNIISYILYNNIKTMIENGKRDRKILKKINENSISIIQKSISLKKEQDEIKKNYGQSLINLSQHYLDEYSNKTGNKHILTQGALEKIKSYKGDISKLKSIIKRAVLVVDNTYYDRKDSVIKITEWNINFNNYEQRAENEESTLIINNKDTKVTQLLDKLENAAQKVISYNNKLTSENVGKSCPYPITAPAITDALKKNRKTIIRLLKQNPEKWQIIRNNFRPIKNILIIKYQEPDKNTA